MPVAPRPLLTFDRAFVSLAAGAVCGGVLVDLALAMFVITHLNLDGRPAAVAAEIARATGIALLFALPVFVMTSLAWLVGLVALGGPVWWALHGLGVRSAWAAAVLGAIAPPAFYLACSLHSRPGSLLQALKAEWALYLTLAAIGAAVGWVVTRIAYGGRGGAR